MSEKIKVSNFKSQLQNLNLSHNSHTQQNMIFLYFLPWDLEFEFWNLEIKK